MKLLIESTGWAGALMVLSAYVLLTLHRLTPTSPSYRWLNVAGSAGLIVNSVANGAFPPAFLNVVWLAMTAYGAMRSDARPEP